MKSFRELESTIKGSAGEQLVTELLEELGLKMYSPSFEGPALVDRLAFINTTLSIIEVKTYPRLYSRPYTGIDLADFLVYRQTVKDNPWTKFNIVFIDPHESKIYILDFSTHYGKGKEHDEKVYFHLNLMQVFASLDADALAKIGWKPSEKYRDVARFFS